MHCSSLENECERREGGDVLVAIAAMVTEGRIPGKLNQAKSRGFYEGPHCPVGKQAQEHRCDSNDNLCKKYEGYRKAALSLWQKGIPLCVEVLLVAACACDDPRIANFSSVSDPPENSHLLEQWYINISYRRPKELTINFIQLINAIRSQLHFSQISAWLATEGNKKITSKNIQYRVTMPGETYKVSNFTSKAVQHNFPVADIGNGLVANVTYMSAPRTSTVPNIDCLKCTANSGPPKSTTTPQQQHKDNKIVDDRMHTSCTLKGKHHCEDVDEYELMSRGCCSSTPSTSKSNLSLNIEKANDFLASKQRKKDDEFVCDRLINPQNFKNYLNDLNGTSKNKGQILLDAILRSGQKSTNGPEASANKSESDSFCDNTSESDIFNIKCSSSSSQVNCDSQKCKSSTETVKGHQVASRSARQKLTFDDDGGEEKSGGIPSASEQAKFRKNLDSAASMVFHSRTGLPLTSSPAPVRRGKSCFDFDSSINSVSAIKSALFSSSFSTDDDSESDCSVVSPCSPEASPLPLRELSPVKQQRRGHANNLLGSFEESVLNGRLEPVSTVHGFKAELGASGAFVPRHLVVPVTVFFYTLGDNDKFSSPYLGHINLGKKGYNVPKTGTVQVTLFNPLGTVVKMFVIMYDLTDMPPNSQTFIRQRTFYMPTICKNDDNLECGQKWLRYLIHLRFMSSKSGRIYLHSDVRMIIFRKSDLDTATAHGIDMSYELRSFTQMPSNPRFSPRK